MSLLALIIQPHQHIIVGNKNVYPIWLEVVREVETDEDLLSEVMGKTDSARDELVEEGLVVKFGDTAMYFDIKIIDRNYFYFVIKIEIIFKLF